MLRISIPPVIACCLLLSVPSVAQPTSPPIADPYVAYLVEGRVVDARGAPVRDARVVRSRDMRGSAPFARGAYETRTASDGSFRFRFAGLGAPTGRSWYVTVEPRGCTPHTVGVQLREGTFDGRRGDVARNLVVRMPPCATNSSPDPISSLPPPNPPAPPARSTPSRRDIVEAMRPLLAPIRRCAERGSRGMVQVRFRFTGASGRVAQAEAVGALPEAALRCVERVASEAHVEPFADPEFEVRFPFRF